MKNLLFLSVIVALALLVGCDREDLTPPTIAMVVNGALAPQPAEAHAGSVLQVTIDLRDDDALETVRLDLHGGAGHAHNGEEAFSLDAGLSDFEEFDTDNLPGNAQSLIMRTFDIPSHVRGRWHLIVDATDAAGNVAETAYMDIHIENDSIPLFEVPYTAEPVWVAGTTVNLLGSLTDADGLASAVARLQDDGGALLAEVAIPLTPGDVAVDLASVSFDLPASAGEVEVVLEATDLLGFNCLTGFHADVE